MKPVKIIFKNKFDHPNGQSGSVARSILGNYFINEKTEAQIGQLIYLKLLSQNLTKVHLAWSMFSHSTILTDVYSLPWHLPVQLGWSACSRCESTAYGAFGVFWSFPWL